MPACSKPEVNPERLSPELLRLEDNLVKSKFPVFTLKALLK
jgi:hypothetical protein